jgi:hypothetical protein
MQMQADMEDDELSTRLIFSDEATFHLWGKVNRHRHLCQMIFKN